MKGVYSCFFFFQAEDGIRDVAVTGVQTCALPIFLETLWAYAHFTGDWQLVRERWPLVKKMFTTPARTRWVGFGRDAIAEIGDEAAHCGAFARLAYRVGDMDAYHYGCSMFAR